MKPSLKDSSPAVDRRAFIKASALAGGGLLVGTYFRFGPTPAFAESAPPVAGDFAPNAFISISSSGAVTIIAPNSEMGQGIRTTFAMITMGMGELVYAFTQLFPRFFGGESGITTSRSYGSGFLGGFARFGVVGGRRRWRRRRGFLCARTGA